MAKCNARFIQSQTSVTSDGGRGEGAPEPPDPPPGSATRSQSVFIERAVYGTSQGLCDRKIGPVSILIRDLLNYIKYISKCSLKHIVTDARTKRIEQLL